jgi:hypothetical protein
VLDPLIFRVLLQRLCIVYSASLESLPTFILASRTPTPAPLLNQPLRIPITTTSLRMRSHLLALALTPSLTLAAPDSVPRITSLKISGNGCPNNSGSVSSTNNQLGDTATFTFNQLRGDDTSNCEIHIQSSGASAGWQVAVRDVAYTVDVALKPGSQLDTITQAFWSEKAADTVSYLFGGSMGQ